MSYANTEELVGCTVAGLCLDRRDLPDWIEQAAIVEPIALAQWHSKISNKGEATEARTVPRQEASDANLPCILLTIVSIFARAAASESLK